MYLLNVAVHEPIARAVALAQLMHIAIEHIHREEALVLCKEGKATALIDSGDNTYGGKYVINPSGGLISKGHPLDATGLAQCAELCGQLRGQAGKRQVKNCTLALQHNLGLGGAVVVTLYRLGFLASANIKFNLPSAASATGERKSMHKFLRLCEDLKVVQRIQAEEFVKLRKYALPMCVALGPSLHYDRVLMYKLLRILRAIITEMGVDNQNVPTPRTEAKSLYNELMTTIVFIVASQY
ncbi:hypothetical protein GQX74_005750 [Glossina fuscipes]|nr:hypothetical protein GQX74_005750 [Glossina fuscipes]